MSQPFLNVCVFDVFCVVMTVLWTTSGSPSLSQTNISRRDVLVGHEDPRPCLNTAHCLCTYSTHVLSFANSRRVTQCIGL
jgi:hypothetical protein